MTAQPDPRLRAFLIDQGLATADAPLRWTPLTGGVSSDIWRVDTGTDRLCVKAALPRLKVAMDWQAPVERNRYEWAWLCFAHEHLPGIVPRPIAHDAQAGAFAMAWLDDARHPVWKAQLLAGQAEAGVAAGVGTALGRLHAASARDPRLAARFPTDHIFYPIRLEPYLIATGARHPDLTPRLHALAARTLATHKVLVHGDVSPKNILVGPDGPVFLDAECAWFGDPAFDLAFCLNHFLLKCRHRPDRTKEYLQCFSSFTQHYLEQVDWEPAADLEQRAAALLPALFLARVDGKSPVEYITAEAHKACVRRVARPLILQPPARLEQIAQAWRTGLRAQDSPA